MEIIFVYLFDCFLCLLQIKTFFWRTTSHLLNRPYNHVLSHSVCACVRVRACVRVCVRVCVRASVCVNEHVRACVY